MEDPSFRIPLANRRHPFVTFELRGGSLLDVFIRFCTPEILMKIICDERNGELSYSARKIPIFHESDNLHKAYLFIALKVAIHVLNYHAGGCDDHQRWLRESVKNAKSELSLRTPCNFSHLGNDVSERLLARFLFTYDYCDELSANFQSIIRSLGEFVSGDEKLFRYLGTSVDSRYEPKKPDKEGFWFYELCAPIDETTGYMLDIRMWKAHDIDDHTEAVAGVVDRWSQVIHNLQHRTVRTTLTFDSYYFDNATREALVENEVQYIAGVNRSRFPALNNKVKNKVKKRGDVAGLRNEDTGETFILKFHEDSDLGVRAVMGNVLSPFEGLGQGTPAATLSDFYALTFNTCDRVNTWIHGRFWNHKHGGHGVLGQAGRQDDFAFGVMLMNTFLVYREINGLSRTALQMKELGLQLAIELVDFADSFSM